LHSVSLEPWGVPGKGADDHSKLVLSAVAIVAAVALFTNAVELLGERWSLGEGAVGSVLAAAGTALPETMIPMVAVAALLTGASAAGDIGVGAILGAPFLLATLAMFVARVTVLRFWRRRQSDDEVTVDEGTAKRDMLYFLVSSLWAPGPASYRCPFI
jgi:cation:H+ antiporter